MVERKPYEDRFAAMMREMENWKPAWKDIRDYIAPTRGWFDEQQPNKGKEIDHKIILNGHATRALGKLASGMTSGLTSPSRPWFKLGLADSTLQRIDKVKEWLGDVEKRMYMVLSKSNIYGELHGIYGETGGFGTGAMSILPDFDDVIRARLYTCGEYALATGPDCRINAFAREQWMTVAQVVKEYGIDNVSETVKNQHTNKQLDEWVRVRQLIQINSNHDPKSPMSKHKKYSSVHWENGAPEEKFLRRSGFSRFPILGPRWGTTTTADIYGRSPAWDTLGDVKMLQKMEKDALIALDKVADPPVQADANVAEQVNLLPGGLTRSSNVSPNAGVRPVYLLNPDFGAIDKKIATVMNAISEGFYSDLFSMISNIERSNVTALEIAKRNEEKLILLGPVLDRLQSELLDPMIDIVFDYMLEAGMIPPIPEELQGVEVDVEYISILAQAQKMVGIASIQQLYGFAGSVAGVKPAILDKLDEDESIDSIAEMLGTPAKIVRSAQQVAKIREERAQQQKAAELAATMPAMVEGAKTLSETKVGENSALDALLAGNQ